MPDFQRNQIPFLHKGMSWNTPIEKLQIGQIPWAKNVRVLVQGSISAAHGHSQAFPAIAAGGVNDSGIEGLGNNFIHTMTRLNVLSPGYDAAVRRTYVIGADNELYVGQNGDTLISTTLNPVITPIAQFLAFSGNPLSVVDAQPAGAAAAWKYIGDSKQMVTVGYYPTDAAGTAMARALTIGLPVPVNTTDVEGLPGGLLQGSYQWAFAFRRVPTGARSNPSAATRWHQPDPSISIHNPAPPPARPDPTTQLNLQKAQMFLPVVPTDPQTGLPDTHVVVDVYRFGGAVLRWALVGSGPSGSIFVDNTPDINLLAAPAPSQVTDQTTGLTRFNLYQPFVTPDIERTGTATVGRTAGNLAWTLSFDAGLTPALPNPDYTRSFDTNWLQGSTINLADPTTGTPLASYTIYQVRSQFIIELMEDATGTLTQGLFVHWQMPAGTLRSGQPLSHLWGPYGIGFSGSYVFACGDANSPGTLYWTNGNDPDSTDIVNNIQVTSPSERLMTGAIYTGQSICWSNERMFFIYPSLTIFGQFTAQEQAGAKGCWLEWSMSVQNNGFADQSVSWRGKDGIYDLSQAAGLQRLTDPLYAFFPHDGQISEPPETLMPFLNQGTEPEVVGRLDDTQPQYHRLTWFHGELFYDFVGQITVAGASTNHYSTLVFDSVNTGGWVSLDQPFASTLLPVARGVMVGANDITSNEPANDDFYSVPGPPTGPGASDKLGPANRGGDMFVSWGATLWRYFGLTRGFFSRFITRAEDMGDSRAIKLFGDYWLDCVPLDTIDIFPLVNFRMQSIGSRALGTDGNQIVAQATPTRTTFNLDFAPFNPVTAGGQGLMQQSVALDIQWTPRDGEFTNTFYQWAPSFVMKPEIISFRAKDRDDQGAVQAKYLMGFNMEANTNLSTLLAPPGVNQPFEMNVIVDGVLVQTFTINHDGQSEKPYGLTNPVAGYEFQVQLSFEFAAAAGTVPQWQLYKIAWIFEVWPDAVARKYPFQNLGTTGDKYIKGIVLPMETNGQVATVTLWGDNDNRIRTWNKSTQPLKKTGVVLDLGAPFLAHEIQFSTLTPHRIWPQEVLVDFEAYPEFSNSVSSFMNLGYVGAKFMQGAVIPMDTGGRPVFLDINSDCGQSVTVGPFTTPNQCKNEFPVSFSPCNQFPSEPFVAHEVQVRPQSNVRIWYDQIKWVWEPEPEMVATWQTQPTDLDLPGWHHLRDCYIAYRNGTNGVAPILKITTEYGELDYTLDVVPAQTYTRCYRVLNSQKAKWRSFRVESCGLFRLYIKDCEVRAKAWGDEGPYRVFQPFGDMSRSNGGARI